jgi:hypothetical protein
MRGFIKFVAVLLAFMALTLQRTEAQVLYGARGGVAAGDDEPPAAPSWSGFRMVGPSLKKRPAPCQESGLSDQ